MLVVEGKGAAAMRESFVPAPEISNCPFCGQGFVKPENPVSPIVFHAGTMTDGKCVLSGMSFREHQYGLLNKRAAA